MGNLLGCVKELKDLIVIFGKVFIFFKKRVRFKREWRGKKIFIFELFYEEEFLEGIGVIEEIKILRKLIVSFGKEEGVGGVEYLFLDILLFGEVVFSLGVGD